MNCKVFQVDNLQRWGRRLHQDTGGQDLLEWTIGLPLFLLLCGAIAFYAWLWWNQTTAAIAIHDGVYLSAMQGGSPALGAERTNRILFSALGNTAQSYYWTMAFDTETRSVYGYIYNDSLMRLPFLGPMPLQIRAGSVQRRERFYGGPPSGWW